MDEDEALGSNESASEAVSEDQGRRMEIEKVGG